MVKLYKNKNLIVLFLFMLPLFASAENGIKFITVGSSSEDLRSGADITNNESIEYKSTFSINFKLSFYKSKKNQYGKVLSLKENKGKNIIQIIFQNSKLFVVWNKKETLFEVDVTKDKLIDYGNWSDISLSVNADSQNITLEFDNKSHSSYIKFPEKSNFDLSLGVVKENGFYTEKVPAINIKDLSINIDSKDSFFWPFVKSDEYNIIYDTIQRKKAILYNPAWISDCTRKWEHIQTFSFNNKPNFIYDKDKMTFYFVFDDGSIKSFNVYNETEKSMTNTIVPNHELSEQFINNNGQLLSYSFKENLISSYDTVKNKWTKTHKVNNALPLWNYNKTIHPISKQITVFGGVDNENFFSIFKSFDENANTWKNLPFSGDTIYPRYLSSFGLGHNNEGYLFGGVGNRKGKKIFSKKFYYDLFKINFKDNSITKLWDYDKFNNYQYIPAKSLVISENKNYFYTLMSQVNHKNTYLKIAKCSLKEPKIKLIGDSIPYKFVNNDSFADLYYCKNKLIALTSYNDNDKYFVNLYRICWEPEEKPIIVLEASFNKGFIYYILVFLCVIALIMIFVSKYKKSKQSTIIKEDDHNKGIEVKQNDISKYNVPTKNSIMLFGRLKIFDNYGNNVTNKLSPKLKELFLLILLNSIDGKKGVSSKEIQEHIWPHKSEKKVVNNRGVNIKKLRDIIKDFDGINIVFSNGMCVIHYSDNLFLDIDEVHKIVTSPFSHQHIGKLIAIIENGKLLPDMNREWLSAAKSKYNELIISYLKQVLSMPDISKENKLKIANIIFKFDAISEVALRYKCIILSGQGNHGLAIESFENYKKMYLNIYKENYKYSYNEVVKSNIIY